MCERLRKAREASSDPKGSWDGAIPTFFGSLSASRAFRKRECSRTQLASSLAKGSWGLGRSEKRWDGAIALRGPIPSFFGSPSAPRAFRQGLAGSLRSHALMSPGRVL
ncbi:hypothetical protein PRIPAC_90415, partial [Pristionchus pacificus]|uniref:Uncharacterized protein n=1 Tax=Pristionchus pacificus TaxID=54126 RepID=A0A2A6CVB3_PRIPA